MSTNELAAKYGEGKVDGFLATLIEAGFASLGGHHGGEGWKEINGRACYVDYWGGAWSLPLEGELSAKESRAKLAAAGAVSLSQVLTAAEWARSK